MYIDNLHSYASVFNETNARHSSTLTCSTVNRFTKRINVLIWTTATNKASNQFQEVAITESNIDISRYIITKVQ